MTLNELPYEEYKGWYIGRGITMPAQGIYEVNIYSSTAGVAAETPDHIVGSVEEARDWIDEQGRLPTKTPEEGLLSGIFGPQYAGECSRCYEFTAYGTKTWDGRMLCPKCFALELREKYGVELETEEELELAREAAEAIRHGSYIIFTNLDTGETRQYFNTNPPDSSGAVSAAMMLKPYLEKRWGEGNVKFEIKPILEGG